MSKSLLPYCEEFIAELEMYEDINHGTTFKKDFSHAIRIFLKDDEPTNEKALAVYEVFSRSYWMIKKDDSILQMIKEMKVFEERAGVLTEKQRDHFIHSVNVFLLGLSIYIKNEPIRTQFTSSVCANKNYTDYYTTKHEEFLYRWGIAALFHDIAYPIEISLKQLKSYLNFISEICGLSESRLEASVYIKNSDVFNLLPKMHPKQQFEDAFFQKYPEFSNYHTNSLSLIALEISNCFGMNFEMIDKEMHSYIDKMYQGNQVDHGYYSALIVLRWFYKLVDNYEWNPVYFYFPILNSVTSIILHNYYKFGLMKPPFNMQQLNLKSHPLSYLLILCDELQDWGRTPYGTKDLDTVYPKTINIKLEDDSIELSYLYENKNWKGESFSSKKAAALKSLLLIDNVFKNFSID